MNLINACETASFKASKGSGQHGRYFAGHTFKYIV